MTVVELKKLIKAHTESINTTRIKVTGKKK